ncbi:Mitochondrial intermediate peptidase, partial [Quaeritorhiza haematococci]
MTFLQSIATTNKPRAQADINRLLSLKRIHLNTPPSTPLSVNPWDKCFYAQFISPASSIIPPSPSSDPFHRTPTTSPTSAALSAYFSVGRTFQGLSRVFSALYGIRLEPAPLEPGETWHPDVRKLEVVHETEGKVGVIYCDLFGREEGGGRKYESAAHFTIRCSRRVDDDGSDHPESLRLGMEGVGASEYTRELREELYAMDEVLAKPDEHDNVDHCMRVMWNPDAEKEVLVDVPGEGRVKKRYQLPVVVLVTGFARPQVDAGEAPVLLTLGEVETLFHEMGHAMH